MERKIVLTRSPQRSKNVAMQLAEIPNAEIVYWELMQITSIHPKAKIFQTIDGVIFISENAVNYGFSYLQKTYQDKMATLDFFAIGPHTANILRKKGVRSVQSPQYRFDSEGLLSLPQLMNIQGKKLLIFRGVGGRDFLKDTLEQRGANVDYIESYQRVYPDSELPPEHRKWHILCLHSSEAFLHFDKLVEKHEGFDKENMTLCIAHSRIKQSAQEKGYKTALTEDLTDEAMSACIRKILTKDDFHI